MVCFWMGLWWDVSYVCCWAMAAAVCWQSEWVMMWPVVPTMVRLGIVLGPLGVMFGMSTEVYRWDVSVGWCVYERRRELRRPAANLRPRPESGNRSAQICLTAGLMCPV